MPWKHDLAKLKQQLKEDPPAPPPPAVRKPAPSPATGPSSIQDEDAMFLAAMGVRRPATPVVPMASGKVEQVPLPSRAVEAEADFASAMSDLKGLKPIPARIPEPAAPAPVPVAPVAEPARAVLPEPVPAPPAPPESAPLPPEPTPAGPPPRIQLAAGMAIEVDGHLDLRGHSRQDAIERLRDRLEDARFMHWRSLHVTLGTASDLHEALQELLGSKGLPQVQRYALAPIPMGGAQAWILYLTA